MDGRCILSKFYIKPQLFCSYCVEPVVVSYRNSTSNHNFGTKPPFFRFVVSYRNSTSNHNIFTLLAVSSLLYLIEILHQTTTFLPFRKISRCCILSKFYIKPQLLDSSTSSEVSCILSKFYIKPQPRAHASDARTVVSYRNSTSNHNYLSSTRRYAELYLIEILHQTTTGRKTSLPCMSCILSKFYIKPQPFLRVVDLVCVVSYRNSTSNHNETRSKA